MKLHIRIFEKKYWWDRRLVISWILYSLPWLFSHIFPRKKDCWVFELKDGFLNQIYPLFIYASKHTSIECIGICDSKRLVKEFSKKGLKVYYKYSWTGISYHFKGKIIFFEEESARWWAGGALCVSVWHGVPLKRIGLDIGTTPSGTFNSFIPYSLKLFLYIPFKPHYLISSSDFISKKCFLSAFGIKSKSCLSFGYPRNDIFFKEKEKILNFIKEYEPKLYHIVQNFQNYKKIFIWLPTFRDTSYDFFKLSNINLYKLNNILKRKNYLLILKFHFSTKFNKKTYKRLSFYSNILLLDRKTNIYPILPLTDMLITDYSSVYFDYLLLDKKILFFPFDKKKYTTLCREFYFPYDEFTPGPKVYSAEELYSFIERFDTIDFSEYTEKGKKIKSYVWTYADDKSCERIIGYFYKGKFLKNAKLERKT